MKSRFLFFIAAIICFAVTFYLLTIPGNQLPKITWMEKYQGDKLVHISMFFVLCFLFSFTIKDTRSKYTWILVISVAGLAYGIIMEFVQKYFIPFRSCDVNDMIADGIGCAINYWWWWRKFGRTNAG
jgi:VanZ family protein